LARRQLLFLLLLLLATGCGSGTTAHPPDDDPPDPVPLPGDLEDGFEAGLGLWTKDAHVPMSPGDPTVPVAWSIEASEEQAFEGRTSARFVLDGSGDDGTIWLERALAVDPATDYTVRISAAYWSEDESFNTTGMVALYAGAASPEVEFDFLIPEQLNLVAGWKTYSASFPVTSASDGSLWVGVGLTVVWETWITYYLDDVRITIDPR